MMPAEVVTAQTEYSDLTEKVQIVEHLDRIGVPRGARRRAGRTRGSRRPRSGRWGWRNGFGADAIEDAGEVRPGGSPGRGHVCVHAAGVRLRAAGCKTAGSGDGHSSKMFPHTDLPSRSNPRPARGFYAHGRFNVLAPRRRDR